MPYGVRGRLIVNSGTVRTCTYRWLQQLEDGESENHSLFPGLSPARKMVSVWYRASQLSRFEYCFFVANHHPGLAFASKVSPESSPSPTPPDLRRPEVWVAEEKLVKNRRFRGCRTPCLH